MSDLDRILKLASHGTADAQSQAPAERQLKEAPIRLKNQRGFTPGEQEPEMRLKNQRGFTPGEPEPGYEPGNRGFTPGEPEPGYEPGNRGFTPGEQVPPMEPASAVIDPNDIEPIDPASDNNPNLDKYQDDEYKDMVRRDDEQTSKAFNFRELLNKLYRKQGSNPATEFSDSVEEAVGEFADPILDLCDELECDSDHPVLGELIRYLDGDTIKDFVADFRRHNDMNGDMDEAQQLNASDYHCSDCGDTMHKPTTDCSNDPHDETGSWWVDKDGNGVPDSLEEAPNEGNEFSGELAKAKASGKKEFEVDGKKYKVESEEADTDTEELEEAQSQAQKDAFAKMLASKKGAKKDESNKEELEESPTMDTTQLITLLKNSGLSEEKIKTKLDEWANTPAGAAEEEATSHGEPYENFAQSVNLSLKRYLDAEDMKVGLKEHKVEDIKEAYKKSKGE